MPFIGRLHCSDTWRSAECGRERWQFPVQRALHAYVNAYMLIGCHSLHVSLSCDYPVHVTSVLNTYMSVLALDPVVLASEGGKHRSVGWYHQRRSVMSLFLRSLLPYNPLAMLRFAAQNRHVIDTHLNFELSQNGAITRWLLFGNICRLQRKRVQSSEGSLGLIKVLPEPVFNSPDVPTSADANHLRLISTSVLVANWWLLTLLASVVIVHFLQWTGAP